MKMFEVGPWAMPFGWVRARSVGEARQKALLLKLAPVLSCVRVVEVKR